ncbi:ATP-dependent DNA helicase, partial [Burkholderia contaminans]
AARDLRLAFANDQIVRMSLAQLGDDHPMFGALDALEAALDALASALASQAERAESLGACLRRARELQDLLAGWVAPGATEAAAKADATAAGDKAASDGDPNEKVRWVEVFAHTVQLHETPLSVAPIFAKQRAGVPRAWVFTSATLSVRGDFTHYAAQMGLSSRRSMTLASPFDYQSQGLLYVPRNLPQPSSPAFTDAVFDAALPAIEAS